LTFAKNDAATTLPLEVFTQKNFAANFFRQKLNFTGKNSKIAFYAPSGELRGNVHGSSMAHGKRVVNFLLVLIELYSPALTVEAL